MNAARHSSARQTFAYQTSPGSLTRLQNRKGDMCKAQVEGCTRLNCSWEFASKPMRYRRCSPANQGMALSAMLSSVYNQHNRCDLIIISAYRHTYSQAT
eukprot:42712-Eustigmatos_ZCMA.PRE.1